MGVRSIVCLILISSLCAGQGRVVAAKKPYSETPFDPAVERLPANYPGNDADRIYQIIERRRGSRTKGEFETTEQYHVRIQRQDEQPLIGSLQMTSLFAFRTAELKSRYDADGGLMKLYVPTSFAVDDAGQVDSSRVAVRVHESISFRSYPASNAFGATTLVKEKDVKSIEIGVVNALDYELRNDPDPELDCFYGPDLRCFYGELRLPPEQARRLKQSARVLVVGSLGQIPIGEGASSGEATIGHPTAYFEQVRYINLQVSEIWIYSPETGTVFLKIRPRAEEAAPKLPE
jgi:hypothetical protein